MRCERIFYDVFFLPLSETFLARRGKQDGAASVKVDSARFNSVLRAGLMNVEVVFRVNLVESWGDWEFLLGRWGGEGG